MNNYYLSDRAISEYLLFHYGTAEELFSSPLGPKDALDFPVRCVRECLDVTRLGPGAGALDLGCAVGRSAFELARFCTHVIGIDKSARFIECARRLKQDGAMPFRFVEQGALFNEATARVPDDIDRRRVRFEEGDASALRPDLEGFDVILLANLIDRLANPRRCLEQLPNRIKPGGQLIVTSPYTWMEEYTRREHWLGGYETNGRRVTSFDALRDALEPSFELATRKDLPFLIREHARKYQWSIAEATVWIRRAV